MLRHTSMLRLTMILLLALLVLATARPSLADQGDNPTSKSEPPGAKSESANAYVLNGDTANLGTGITTFQTASGDSMGGWRFIDLHGNATALSASCSNGTNCWGMKGIGTSQGVVGYSTNTDESFSYAVHGISSGITADAAGVFGEANNSNPNNKAAGVIGKAAGSASTGVYGTAKLYGVRGETFSNQLVSYGVYGKAKVGIGVHGTTDADSQGAGVVGSVVGGSRSNAIEGYADEGHGVQAITHGTPEGWHSVVAGVHGHNFRINDAAAVNQAGSELFNVGVYGTCENCTGIYGRSSIGVRGVGTGGSASYGGLFTSTQGAGVYAISGSNFGIYGYSHNFYGLAGGSNSSIGIRGTSTSGTGLYADSKSNLGALIRTDTGQVALRVTNANPGPGDYAIIADGDVLVNGQIICSAGCTQAQAVKTSKGDKLVYAEAATTSRIADEGTATLKNGRAVIAIDPLFAEAVDLGAGYHVFAMPNSADTLGLAIVNKTAISFEVVELNKGKGNFTFDWRLTAPRKGTGAQRLAPAPTLPSDDFKPDDFGE